MHSKSACKFVFFPFQEIDNRNASSDHKVQVLDVPRGGHRVMFLENHYRTPDSEGLLNV